MMGLRLRDGVSFERCKALSGLNFWDMVDDTKLQHVCDEGWACVDDNAMHLTREGLLRLNALISYLLT